MNASKEKEEKRLLRELSEIVSERYVSADVFEGMKNATAPFGCQVEQAVLPFAVAMPATAEEISRILKLANRENISVFVRGSGTSLIGQSKPHCRGIIVNTHRMQEMTVHEEFGYFECQPGISAAKVGERLEEINCFLPIWPGSRVVASMGGLVCNNTSGHIVDACFGKPGDYIMGLEVVLPDGEIVQTGSKGLRRIAGTDLTKFFIGSDGIMGVVTRIRMRLVPAFKQAYGVAVFKDLANLARGVRQIFINRLPPPLFMEMMDQPVARIGYTIKKMEPPSGAVVLFGASDAEKQGAVRKISRMLEVFSDCGAMDVKLVEDEQRWHRIVAAREVIGSYLLQQVEGVLNSAEVVSNLAQLEEAMTDVIDFHRGLPLLGTLDNYIFGHIGALTFHPSFVFPRRWTDDEKKAALKEMFEKEAALNLKYDTCGGEWGQFGMRTPFFKKKFGEGGYDLVKAFKATLDPNNILNPGIIEGYR